MATPKRQSLATFSPKAEPAAPNVVKMEAPALKPPTKYHKINVYLTADEVRTIKLIGLDSGQRISDIGATAVREWLERNGHARAKARGA